MLTQKQARQEGELLAGLQATVVAFKELAAASVRKMQKRVLVNRDFLSGLSRVYQQVKFSYKKELVKNRLLGVLAKKKKGETVRVLLTANTGLYGPIIQKTFNLFKKELQAHPSTVVIIGKMGRSLYEQTGLSQKFTYFELPDRLLTYSQIKQMIDYLKDFSTVIVYHGFFENVSSQRETASEVSGGRLVPKTEEEIQTRWLFEPPLPEVTEFFEREIFSSLFVQAFHEGQLAKFASRMVTLDQAEEKIREASKIAFWYEQRLKYRLLNQKQLSALAGMRLWK